MLPLSIISGYLGAGKTTLINRLLAESQQPIGVCVNDFGELNIDAQLLQQPQSAAGQTIELTNGCVCCKLSDDLGGALNTLSNTDITHVIIEASGVALPGKIAQYGRNWPGYKLHALYSLADALNIKTWLADKYIGGLAQAQLDQAHRVLVTKLDQVGPSKDLSWLNSTTTPIQPMPQNSLDWFFNEPTTKLDPAILAPSADTEESHTGDLRTFTYQTEKRLNSKRLSERLENLPQIPRAKGWFKDELGQGRLLQKVGQQTHMTAYADVTATVVCLIYHAEQTDLRVLQNQLEEVTC